MSKRTILDAVPESRRLTIYHEQDGKTFVESRQDCTAIVEAAKALKGAQGRNETFRLAAVVPETVLNQSFLEGWFHDPVKWQRWMNDPENRDFRVWEGRI